MTPPIRPPGGGPSITILPPPVVSSTPETTFRYASGDRYIPPITLNAPFNPDNPIQTPEPVSTLGNVRDALVFRFIRDQLGAEGKGAEVVQQLGSFPGFLHPETPISNWRPDERPDFNIIGDSRIILERLAPLLGWSPSRMAGNIQRAQAGMVYFNPTLDTPDGPIRFKIGIIDTNVWRRGSFYFDIRASMLPEEGTYTFLHPPGTPGERPDPITPEELEGRTLRVQAELMARSLDTFVFRSSFSAEQLVRRRFFHQFGYYDLLRGVFIGELRKGRKQLERYREMVPEMMVPGLVEYLRQNPGIFEVRHPELGVLSPDQISRENFSQLQFTWQRSFSERLPIRLRRLGEQFWINGGMLRQTGRNIASNWGDGNLAYFGRKVMRAVGGAGSISPVEYRLDGSYFSGPEERLGAPDNPLSQMIILAGYGPLDERDPSVLQEKVEYAEAEISQGKKPNLLIRGNNPSKFTMPVGGVSVIHYRFMDALRSPAIKDIVVVGTPDVGVALDAFQEHFGNEIRERGKRFIYVNTGLEGGGFAKNLLQGIEALPQKGEMAVLSYGDTPRVDIHNVANHPWRHHLDYIFGANARDMVLDFMGMNAHYQADIEGVHYPEKEGNVQGIRVLTAQLIRLFERIFANRKTVKSGPWGKVQIVLGTVVDPQSLRSLADVRNWINLAHILADVVPRSGMNAIHRLSGGRPPKVGVDVDLAEQVVGRALNWRADFRPHHIDPGGLVDVDGIRDYIVAELLSRVFPHAHQADLDAFAQTTLRGYRDRLPALEGTPKRINALYLKIYNELLQREAERPSWQALGKGEKVVYGAHWLASFIPFVPDPRPLKLGITSDGLNRLGFDPNCLPFLDDGSLNPEWLQRTIPESEIEGYRRAFAAYENRANHALGLEGEFARRHQTTQLYDQKVSPRTEVLALRLLAADPEYYRGLILEWEFDRVLEAAVKTVQGKQGFTPERLSELRRYFEMSTVENRDTPLRRVLMGMKAVDVLRRYVPHLSPAEFRHLYVSELVPALNKARGAVPGNAWLSAFKMDGGFYLRSFLDQAQVTADRVYIEKTGESPPQYRTRSVAGFPLLASHSRNRAPLLTDSQGRVFRADASVFRQADINLLSRRLEILPSHIPHLIAAGAQATSVDNLSAIPNQMMTYERLLAWTQSTQGQEYLRGPERLRRQVNEFNARSLALERRSSEPASEPSSRLSRWQKSFQNWREVRAQRSELNKERRAWSRSPEGQEYFKGPWMDHRDTFRNRLLEGGPGLGMGIATLFGAEYLADQLGIDGRLYPHERFAFVVGASHLVNQGTSAFSEVLMNRYVHHAPFDFVTTRAVAAGSEMGVQYSFQARQSLGRALFDSVFRNYGLYGGISGSLGRGLYGAATLPFRASWNMGPGLMSAALTDHFFSEGLLGLAPDSRARQAIHFGSFFLPDVYNIALGTRGPAIFRSRGMRFAGRAFAVGFMADMAFMGLNRMRNGSEGSATLNNIYQQTNALHDQRERGISRIWDGALTMMAPSLMAWWDSVEFDFRRLDFVPNQYQREVRSQLHQLSVDTTQQTEDLVSHTLLHGLGDQALNASFYSRVDWSLFRDENLLRDTTTPDGRELPVEMVAEQISQPRIAQRLQGMTADQRIHYIQDQFSGFDLNRGDVENILGRISLHQIRSQISTVHHFAMPENQTLRHYFDEQARLRSGRESELLGHVYEGQVPDEAVLLQHRRAQLAQRISRLRAEASPEAQAELNQALEVAREIGLGEGDMVSMGPPPSLTGPIPILVHS